MILANCFPFLQVKCIKISVEGISYGVTVRLISSLTSFSFNAEQFVFILLPSKTRPGCFLLNRLLAIMIGNFQKIPGQLGVFFYFKIAKKISKRVPSWAQFFKASLVNEPVKSSTR